MAHKRSSRARLERGLGSLYTIVMKGALHGVGLGLVVFSAGVVPARAQDGTIPTDGLELWVKADGPMTATDGQITQWTDLSGKANHAIHDAFGQATPTLATANGQPTLRFSGVYTGFHFTQITTIRTVFAVLSKDSTSCLPTLPNYGTSAKFWLGGNANPTYFHPEHGCGIAYVVARFSSRLTSLRSRSARMGLSIKRSAFSHDCCCAESAANDKPVAALTAVTIMTGVSGYSFLMR